MSARADKWYSESSWCSSYTTVTSAAPSTSFSFNCDVAWDDTPVSVPFDPPEFISPTCTDTGNVWNYWLEEDSSSPNNPDDYKFKIAVDGVNNLITVMGLAHSGSPSGENYKYKLHYSSPDGYDGEFVFTVTMGTHPCSGPTLTAPSVTA